MATIFGTAHMTLLQKNSPNDKDITKYHQYTYVLKNLKKSNLTCLQIWNVKTYLLHYCSLFVTIFGR